MVELDMGNIPTSYYPFFWALAAISMLLVLYTLRYACKYRTQPAFILPPFVCLTLTFDNVVMAISGLDRRQLTTKVMLGFHASTTPLLLLICFDLGYLVHKHKAIRFCGVNLNDSGRTRVRRQVNHMPTSRRCRDWQTIMLHGSVWLLAFGLFILQLLATYRAHPSHHHHDNLTELQTASIYDLQGDPVIHIIGSVLPAGMLVLFSLYVGIALWRYGTFVSYNMDATCCNPWIYMLVGSIFLVIGYMMPSPYYPLTSNCGEVAIISAIARMFRTIEHDVEQGQSMQAFIDPTLLVRPSFPPLSTTIHSSAAISPRYLDTSEASESKEQQDVLETSIKTEHTIPTSVYYQAYAHDTTYCSNRKNSYTGIIVPSTITSS